jgi:hypothetical protein
MENGSDCFGTAPIILARIVSKKKETMRGDRLETLAREDAGAPVGAFNFPSNLLFKDHQPTDLFRQTYGQFGPCPLRNWEGAFP